MSLGPGQIFGEEYLINSLNSEDTESATKLAPLYTIKCRSALGEVLVISEEEFQKKIMVNLKTINLIIDNCDSKAKRCEELLANECAYINPVSAWKRLEEEGRKQLAEHVTQFIVQHKLIETSQAQHVPLKIPRLNLNTSQSLKN